VKKVPTLRIDSVKPYPDRILQRWKDGHYDVIDDRRISSYIRDILQHKASRRTCLTSVLGAVDKDKAIYIGGTLLGLPRGANLGNAEGRINTQSDSQFVFDAGTKGSIAIPYGAIVTVKFGRANPFGRYDAREQRGNRVFRGIFTPGITIYSPSFIGISLTRNKLSYCGSERNWFGRRWQLSKREAGRRSNSPTLKVARSTRHRRNVAMPAMAL
jgi:hypothetical protein